MTTRSDRPPDEKNTPPAGLTEDQLNEWIDKKLGATVNNAVTARLTTFEKKITGSLGTSIADALKAQLPEFLKDFRPPKDPDDPEPGKKSKKDDPELATLRQQQAALAQRLAESEQRANELRSRQRTIAIRDQARGMLAKFGIDGERFDAAYALLDHSGKIVPAEDVNSDDAFFRKNTGEDPVILEVGLADWVKNDQMAKLFLPPSNTRGSGSRPGARAGGGGPLSPEQVRANIAAELERELGR